jgi:hypothetical protein
MPACFIFLVLKETGGDPTIPGDCALALAAGGPSTAAPPFSGSGSRKNREAVMWVRHRGSVTRCGEPPHAGSVMLAHAHVRSDAVSASSSALRTLSNRRGIKTCLHPGCRRPARRRSPRRPLRSARSYQTPKPAPSSAVCTVLSNI